MGSKPRGLEREIEKEERECIFGWWVLWSGNRRGREKREKCRKKRRKRKIEKEEIERKGRDGLAVCVHGFR